MKVFTAIIIFFCTAIPFSEVAFAATSEVTWVDYEKYRDIHPGEGHRKHFRESTFASFEKHFSKLAEKLPREQALKITVTDIDLAGDTHDGGISQIRIVRDIYFPRMSFSYQLLDDKGNELTADSVELKDMNFMMSSSLKYRHEALSYEKKMLDYWFFSTFKDRLIQKN